jgi:Carbohydrate-selective porin, OprB family/S-layer homology domain
MLSNNLWSVFAIAPVLIAVLAEVSQPRTVEAEAIGVSQDMRSQETLSQVTSVSQLSDVQPTDWAFTALQSLVERYGCVAGYPDKTYLGNRALSRYEFSAGLNACLDRISELMASSTADLVTQEDLATLQRLQTEYAIELMTLRGRVDSLEARTTTLEAHQFSTTTKLEGEAVFLAADVFGGNAGRQNNIVLQDRVDLDFITSFTGSDRLTAQLEAGNVVAFNTPTAESNFGNQMELADEADTGNRITLNQLEYVFPLNDAIQISVEGTGGSITDIASSISPLDDDAQGGLSYFSYNPIYDIGGQSTGVGANIQLNDTIDVAVGYLAGAADNPALGSGLFNGSYAAFAQLTLTPASFPLTLGLTYVNGYTKDPATVSNAYGLEANYELSKAIEIGGWVGYIHDRVLSDPAAMGNGRTWTYAGTLLFHDFGREGNDLGFIVGVPPRQAEFRFANPNAADVSSQREDAALHVEAFYTYQLNDNISITPGVIWLMDPGNNNSNSDIVVGAIRTTFTF